MSLAPTLTLEQAAGRTWPVVVVGAGPAGAVAAGLIARAGSRVLLVDRSTFPRAKVCGCCLNGRALAALADAGLGDLPARLGAVPLTAFRARGGRARGRVAARPGRVAVARGVRRRTDPPRDRVRGRFPPGDAGPSARRSPADETRSLRALPAAREEREIAARVVARGRRPRRVAARGGPARAEPARLADRRGRRRGRRRAVLRAGDDLHGDGGGRLRRPRPAGVGRARHRLRARPRRGAGGGRAGRGRGAHPRRGRLAGARRTSPRRPGAGPRR